jgi:hypothetical protein
MKAPRFTAHREHIENLLMVFVHIIFEYNDRHSARIFSRRMIEGKGSAWTGLNEKNEF